MGVVFFGVGRGIERTAKFLMPILLSILVMLVIYSFWTPGFKQAIGFLFRPNFSELTAGGVLEALGHSFFTLSLGMGTMLTYGSYMRKRDSIPRAALTICVLDTVIAIMACIIMFSIIFSYDFEVTKSSTILFTTVPVVFFQLPGGAVVSALFYLLVAFAALTSTISLLEVVSSYAIDELGWRRRRATLTMGAAIFAFGILSAISMGGNAALSNINLIGRPSTAGVFGTLDYAGQQLVLAGGWSPHCTLRRLDSEHRRDSEGTRGRPWTDGAVVPGMAFPDPVCGAGRGRRDHRQRASRRRVSVAQRQIS